MTREEFVRHYATNSKLPSPWAMMGLLEVEPPNKWTVVAMPCACGDESCLGWAMVAIEFIDHHLTFHAPEPLRSAYREATEQK